MTIEQLERANELYEKMQKLRRSYENLKNECYKKEILTFQGGCTCLESMKDNTILDLKKYPDLTRMILEYISNQIKELEKQLEEL